MEAMPPGLSGLKTRNTGGNTQGLGNRCDCDAALMQLAEQRGLAESAACLLRSRIAESCVFRDFPIPPRPKAGGATQSAFGA